MGKALTLQIKNIYCNFKSYGLFPEVQKETTGTGDRLYIAVNVLKETKTMQEICSHGRD